MKSKRDDIYSAPLFKAWWNNSVQVSSGVWYKVPLNVASIDNRGTFNSGGSKYSVPESGIYHVLGRIYSQMYLNPNNWSLNAAIWKNGATLSMGEQQASYPTGPGTSWVFLCLVNDLVYLAKNDVLELYTLAYSVSTIIIGNSDPGSACFMAAQRVG